MAGRKTRAAGRDRTIPAERALERSDVENLVGIGLALAVLLLLARARLMGLTGWGWFAGWKVLPGRIVWATIGSCGDFMYVTLVTAVFVLLSRAVRPSRARRIVRGIFLAVALISILIALLNVKVVQTLGTPLSYRWLYYSDFLDSQEVRDSIAAEFSWKLAVAGAAAAAGLVGLASLFRRGLHLLSTRFGPRRLTRIAIALLLIYFPLARAVIAAKTDVRNMFEAWNPNALANPIFYFASSALGSSGQAAALLRMPTTVGPKDFEPAPASSPGPRMPRAAPGLSNVLFFVLESVPAEYLDAYGGRYAVTPQLGRALDGSTVFTNIYAHGATTSQSLASLLLSLYPWISYRSLTKEYPAVPFPSLSSELARRGYRTAFFSSADNRYQRTDAFLANHGFDRVEDYHGVRCGSPVRRVSRSYSAGDDECMLEAFLQWVRSDPRHPCFGVFWTIATHHPYFAAAPETDFGVGNAWFNRYLNALRDTDRLIGKLLRALAEAHLDQSTLVVVLGDHGESFGQHGEHGHGAIYEHSLHVPLILIHPGSFHGQRDSVVGGLIDVAPTVLDLLGIEPPARWQGRSLYRSDRSPRVYFFSPFSRLFGFREGDRKVIYSASRNRFEIYDLATDPKELVNRADEMAQLETLAHERIAAWVQYQDGMMRRLLSEPHSASAR